MPSALEMKISVDLNSVKVFLDDVKFKALTNATRKSMNRALSALQTQASRVAREERKLKLREIKTRYFRLTKAKGNRLHEMKASLEISGKPLSLIHFVVGNKEPRSQAGIPVRKRKSIRVEVKPGRKVQLKSAFITRGRGGNNQIFRRRGKRSYPIVKQSVPSLAAVFSRDKIRKPLESFAQAKLSSEFEKTFQFEINKIAERRAKR